MGLLLLIGFAGAVVLLGFLSCLAGGSTDGGNARRGRGQFDDAKWRANREVTRRTF